VDLGYLSQWADLVASSNTVSEFAKKFVHSSLTSQSAVGVHIYQLDSKGQFKLIGGYGINPIQEKEVSAWDNHVLAQALQENLLAQAECEIEQTKYFLYAIPIIRANQPLGVAISVSREKLEVFPAEVNYSMSRILGIWFYSLGFSSERSGKAEDANPEQLTERQLKILDLISRGMTNAQIAQQLILSESSIRQETVRIYRALGVDSREEASKRAIHLGLLAPIAASA
jgi:DNA-binding CsgD family transcriptional regulator